MFFARGSKPVGPCATCGPMDPLGVREVGPGSPWRVHEILNISLKVVPEKASFIYKWNLEVIFYVYGMRIHG